jgi:hypothetical protein
MTKIIEQISKILTSVGFSHESDPILKSPDTNQAYFRICKRKNRNIVSHVIKRDIIHAIVRKTKDPIKIRELYGIEGKNEDHGDYANHYIFAIPMINGLINGKWSILKQKAFFIDTARER